MGHDSAKGEWFRSWDVLFGIKRLPVQSPRQTWPGLETLPHYEVPGDIQAEYEQELITTGESGYALAIRTCKNNFENLKKKYLLVTSAQNTSITWWDMCSRERVDCKMNWS